MFPYGFPALLTAVPWIALLARGIDRVTVTYVPVRGRNHDVNAERSFIAALRPEVPTVEVDDALRRPICAWAYPRSLGR